jgi:hypothetical protein
MERRSDASFTVLAGVLFALVAVAAFFFVMLVRAPSAGGAEIHLSQPTQSDCPSGDTATTCYVFMATNVGTGSGQIVCQLFPATGTTATFGNHTGQYATPPDALVPPNGAVSVTALVSTDASASPTPAAGSKGSSEGSAAKSTAVEPALDAPTVGCGTPA